MHIHDAVASRRSIRDFSDKPVNLATLHRVLDKVRWAPSGCNYQPWRATVLTGKPLAELQAKMLAASPQQPPEYIFSQPQQSPLHSARLHAVNSAMYGALGISRENKEERERQSRKNLTSFGAPVVLLCHFERFMGPAQWSDVGMWLQTIMLLLCAEGLDSCAQEWLSFYAKLIKDHIGVSDEEHILFCGLAIGHRKDVPLNAFDRERVPLAQQVHFEGFN